MQEFPVAAMTCCALFAKRCAFRARSTSSEVRPRAYTE